MQSVQAEDTAMHHNNVNLVWNFLHNRYKVNYFMDNRAE